MIGLLHTVESLDAGTVARINLEVMSFADLPKFDELEDKKRFWPAKPGTRDEGLGMLRYLTPAHVAEVVKSEVKTGERVSMGKETRMQEGFLLTLAGIGMSQLGDD